MVFESGFLNSIEIVVPLPVSLLPPVHFSNDIDTISCGKVALRFCFVAQKVKTLKSANSENCFK
jgi:hypothetical protein